MKWEIIYQGFIITKGPPHLLEGRNLLACFGVLVSRGQVAALLVYKMGKTW